MTLDVTTERNFVLSQIEHIGQRVIHFTMHSHPEFSEGTGYLVDSLKSAVEAWQDHKDLLSYLLTAVITIQKELTICRLTGCTSEPKHQYLQGLLDIIHNSHNEVMQQAQAEGKPLGQSLN